MNDVPFSKIASRTLNLFFLGVTNHFNVNIWYSVNQGCCFIQPPFDDQHVVFEKRGSAEIVKYGASPNPSSKTPAEPQVTDVNIQMPFNSNLFVYSSCASLALHSSVPHENVALILMKDALVEAYARNQTIRADAAATVVCLGRGGGKLNIVRGGGDSRFDVRGAFLSVNASICERASLDVDGLVLTCKLNSVDTSRSNIYVEHLKSCSVNGGGNGKGRLFALSIGDGRFNLSEDYAFDVVGNVQERKIQSYDAPYLLTRDVFERHQVRMPVGASRLQLTEG